MDKSLRSSELIIIYLDKIPLLVSAFNVHTVLIGLLVMFDGIIFMYNSLRVVFVSSRKLYHRVFNSKILRTQSESTNYTSISTKMIQILMANPLESVRIALSSFPGSKMASWFSVQACCDSSAYPSAFLPSINFRSQTFSTFEQQLYDFPYHDRTSRASCLHQLAATFVSHDQSDERSCTVNSSL